jgi:hypothetical protein
MSEENSNTSVSINQASVSPELDGTRTNLENMAKGSTVSAESVRQYHEDLMARAGQAAYESAKHLPPSERTAAIQAELAKYADPSIASSASLADAADRINTQYKNPLEIDAPQQQQAAQSQESQGFGLGSLFGGLASGAVAYGAAKEAANEGLFAAPSENNLAQAGELRGTEPRQLSAAEQRIKDALPSSQQGVELNGVTGKAENLNFAQMENQLSTNAQRAQTAAIGAGVMPERQRDGAALSFG